MRREEKRQQGDSIQRVLCVFRDQEEVRENVRAESLTGRKISYSEAWLPDLEIDSLVSLG